MFMDKNTSLALLSEPLSTGNKIIKSPGAVSQCIEKLKSTLLSLSSRQTYSRKLSKNKRKIIEYIFFS